MNKREISIDRLDEVFLLDADAGVLTWKAVLGTRIPLGSRAGHVTPKGYRAVGVDGRQYLEHRVIFAMFHRRWPVAFIDHANRDPADNRISNLREATPSQNNGNMRTHTRSKTGLKGVHFAKKSGKYRAQIMTPRGRKFLGHFDSAEDGHAAYVNSAEKVFGEFARAA